MTPFDELRSTPSAALAATNNPVFEHAIASRWSPSSRWSVGIVLGCLTLMHYTPMLEPLGVPLSFLATAAAVFNPFAAFLFVAGSQIAPDPPEFPLTLAQLFVAAWILTLPFNGCLGGLPAISKGLRFTFPFILMWIAIGFLNETIDETMIYALVTAAILCTYVPLAAGNYERLLMMLVLGASLGILGYWGTAVGLSMEGLVYDQFDRGGLRMGSGRADVNFASVNVGFALWTAIVLSLSAAWAGNRSRRGGGIVTVLFVFAIMVIPLVAMGSRAALVYIFFGGFAVGLYVLTFRAMRTRALALVLLAPFILLVLLPVLWPIFWDSAPGQMLLATLQFNEIQAGSQGSDALSVGRRDIWDRFFKIAMDYPIFGAPKGAVVDMGEYGFAVVGEVARDGAGRGGAAHNVLLDMAVSRGFLTAILFAFAFVAPVVLLIKRRGALYALPFAIAHVMVLLAFSNLSIGNWKTYWALHVLTAVAASGAGRRALAKVPRRQR